MYYHYIWKLLYNNISHAKTRAIEINYVEAF